MVKQAFRKIASTARRIIKPQTPVRRRVRNIAIAAGISAALIFGGHSVAKKHYGSAYPKRIPGIARIYTDRNAVFDFYLEQHGKKADLDILEQKLKEAKAKGTPYNVLVSEAGNMGDWRKKDEKYWAETFEKMRSSKKTEADGLRQLDAYGKSKSEYLGDNPEHAAHTYRLAYQHGLRIKWAEEYTEKEVAETMQRFQKSLDLTKAYYDAPSFDPELRRRAIKATALEFYYRDTRISETLRKVRVELKEEFGEKPIRAIVLLGPVHYNARDRFDRETRSIVRTAHQRKDYYALNKEAAELAAKSHEEIENY